MPRHKRALFITKPPTGLRWCWISIFILLSDHVTKILAQRYLTPYVERPIFPSVNLTLSYNRGSAFSFLDSASGWQTWLFGSIAIIASLIILGWLRRLPATQKWTCIALTLILGGALGNLWDRIAWGHVIDFIDLSISYLHWPAFNLADSAICIGAIMLLIDTIRH